MTAFAVPIVRSVTSVRMWGSESASWGNGLTPKRRGLPVPREDFRKLRRTIPPLALRRDAFA